MDGGDQSGHDGLVQMLMEITGKDLQPCRQMLEDNSWNLEVAVEQMLAISHAMGQDSAANAAADDAAVAAAAAADDAGGGGVQDVGQSPSPVSNRVNDEPPMNRETARWTRQYSDDAVAAAEGMRRRVRPGAAAAAGGDSDSAAASPPARSTWEGTDAEPAPAAAAAGWWGLLTRLIRSPFDYVLGPALRFLMSFFGALIPTVPKPDPPETLRAFFESEQLTGPKFFNGPLKEALATSKKDLKFMLLYIHRVGHPIGDRICRQTLATPSVAEFLNDNLIFWGETNSSREGRVVEAQLRRLGPAGVPFFAMVCLKQHQMQVVWHHFGFVAPEDLLSHLVVQMEQNQSALVEEQANRDQNVLNQSIRAEQDAAYEASLEEDRNKAAAARAVEVKLKAEEDAKEEAVAAEAAAVLERETTLETKKTELPEPPAKGEPSTRIRLKFPDGATVNRVFSPDNTVSCLFDFVDVEERVAADFSLFTAHPRAVIENSDKTFAEAGLVPAARIMVEDNTV